MLDIISQMFPYLVCLMCCLCQQVNNIILANKVAISTKPFSRNRHSISHLIVHVAPNTDSDLIIQS
jgi:hypothetical protein